MNAPPILRIDDYEGVRRLTLNRPEAKNAFTDELYDAVRLALAEASADPTVAVCVITAAGDAFCAGTDLKALAAVRDRPDAGKAFGAFAKALVRFDKPLVAAVNGAAVGVGTTMLLHCDLVLVSDRARFKLPFVTLGLVPEAGSTALLPATIGPQSAAQLLFTGDWMDAEEAVRRGLAWKRSTPEDLIEDALAIARRIAVAPIEALKKTKDLLRASRAQLVEAAIDREQGELAEVIAQLRATSRPTGDPARSAVTEG